MIDNRYVCNECAGQFKELIGNKLMHFQEMRDAFQEFMNSEKSLEYGENPGLTVEEFLQYYQRY